MGEPASVGAIVAVLLAKALNRAEDGAIDGAMQVAHRALESLVQSAGIVNGQIDVHQGTVPRPRG